MTAGIVRPSLFILVLCSTVQPFALNVLAPATPSIARALSSDYGTIQLTLTLYLATVAVSQLLVGPLSDRIGRRPCVIGGLLLFVVGSLIGAATSSLVPVLGARMLQAAGAGTAFALVRAIARDLGGKDEAASLIGYITMAMVVAPMIAPLVGGTIDKSLGWRAIFLAMAALGAVAVIGAWRGLPETRKPPEKPGGWLDSLRAFPILFGERAFVLHSLGVAMTSAVFFTFIAGAPYVVVEHLKASPMTYGLLFIMMSGSYMFGNFLTGRFSMRFGAERLASVGTKISCVGVALAAAAPFLFEWQAWMIFAPLVLNGIGNGLTIGPLTAAALSVRPDMAGSAAGITGFLQLGAGALGSYVAGILTPGWPPAFLLLMLLATVTALALDGLNRSR